MSQAQDIARWKGALLTRTDSQFFDIMRSSIGKIETPFNKHALVQKLIAFLRKQETRSRIVALVSQNDAFLLSAIFVLNGPDIASLYDFLKGTVPYLDLHHHLLNLEERLLVFRSLDGVTEHFYFNPLLIGDLRSSVLDTDLVFESRENSKRAISWLTDQLLLATIAYIREKPALFRAGGGFRSRISVDIKERFSFQDTPDAPKRLSSIVFGLERAGVVSEEKGEYKILPDRLAAFGALSPVGRAAWLAGGFAVAAAATAGGEPVAADGSENVTQTGGRAEEERSVLHGPTSLEYASGARLLLERAGEGRSYPVLSMRRMLVAGGLPFTRDESVQRLVDSMLALGLLSPEDEDSYSINSLPETEAWDIGRPSVVVQPNFEITLTQSALFAAAVPLALGAEIRSYDTYPVFELTREAVTRRFSDGESAHDFAALLRDLSGIELPANVAFSLESWEHEYNSIRIFRGSVLLVNESRRHLIEHNHEMAGLIVSNPAPGVYLLDTSDQELIERTLKKCGIDQAPAMERTMRIAATGTGDTETRLKSIESRPPRIPIAHRKEGDTTGVSARELTEELTLKLGSMKLDNTAREQLARMIDKRLIIYPEQLEFSAAAPAERQEAKGFDYVGKVRIIERVLSKEYLLLEIITRTDTGNSVKYLVKPVELEKGGSDLYLICRGLPDQNELRLQVRSMSMVRSVRGSHYGN